MTEFYLQLYRLYQLDKECGQAQNATVYIEIFYGNDSSRLVKVLVGRIAFFLDYFSSLKIH